MSMKSYQSYAWKEMKSHKVTSILILIAVILSTMMTTAIGQSIGILDAMRQQQAASLNGNRYATFHQLAGEQMETLMKNDRIAFAGSFVTVGVADLGTSGMSVQLREYFGEGLSVYPTISQLKEGRLPQKAGEAALPEDALQFLGFKGEIGDTISLDAKISLLRDTQLPYEYTADFTLTGILKSNYLGYASGTVSGIVGAGTASELLPERYMLYSADFRTKGKANFQQTVYHLADQLNVPEEHIQYNWVYLNALGIPYDKKEAGAAKGSGFSYMKAAGIFAGSLTLMAAGLVIYNILKIAVAKRMKEYGILRAIGAERGQLYRLVAMQLLLLCAIGIPPGAIVGVLSAEGITAAATGLFSPEALLAGSPEELAALVAGNRTGRLLPLIISAVVTLLSSFIAAMPAARYAAKVSPMISISGRTAAFKRKNRKSRRIRRFEAYYAKLNLKRNPGRTAITILSMAMSFTVFVALQSFSNLLDTSNEVRKMHLGDYSITNDLVGFAPSIADELKKQPEVVFLHTLKFSLYKQDKNGMLPIRTSVALSPGETFQIVGVDAKRLPSLAPSLTAEEMQKLKDGKACLIKNPIALSYEGAPLAATSISAGDTISVGGMELDVIAISDRSVGLDNAGFVNGVQVIVFDTVYDALTGQDAYSEVYPVLADKADARAFEAKIEEIAGTTPGSRWLSYRDADRQLEESYRQIQTLAWGVILFIGFIGVLNIVNTVYTNIHTRIAEIGVQRAIGMSASGLYRTFMWEGAYYGMIASAIGAAAGSICTVLIGAAAAESVSFTAVPVIPMLQATVISILACLLATCIPLRQIASMNIADSIERAAL
ncbi:MULTISPECIES: ABC transporter permease [unclassified Paenibacillus]|uniref:ABC transporter permease n=1 Tax=unclassified Paenibacillus TaxID=185978 RepID=UPI001C0FDD6D|nr:MULTISPECIES: ABC transporter permease [unclassified Paenibacillus]MBU5443083.1 ABC transporter permease [Paenibacillus sp. MSJ-34]CAH0122255.1 hypothetical protein PAE9249_04803 [Paenibacillus sp. CECT 9249]